MRRRTWLAVVVALAAGCSSSRKKPKPKSMAAPGPRGKRPKGPQTMGNLLVDGYIADLRSDSADKRIRAAHELGNMGATARPAVPTLEKMAQDSDRKVSAAAKAALLAIRKR